MSFFERFFHTETRKESIILIDIGADGVAGAYARYEEGLPPTLLYSRRVPIETRPDETHERAMFRALDFIGKDLIKEGAPILFRAVGSGSADLILVSVDAPWQETKVRCEEFESAESFVFTAGLVEKRLKETDGTSSDEMVVDESIIGTILNGYETRKPYGKSAECASVVVLSSFIARPVADGIISILRGLFHTKNIMPITGGSLRYQAMRAAFPHERDFLIIDATGGKLASISLVLKGIFISLAQLPTTPDVDAWTTVVSGELKKLSQHYPLPRTIFLLAREPEIVAMRAKLDTKEFATLWLSDNPPKIISLVRSSLTGMLTQTAANPTDIVLMLMALYHQNRRRTEES
jgi:hypothetical protein